MKQDIKILKSLQNYALDSNVTNFMLPSFGEKKSFNPIINDNKSAIKSLKLNKLPIIHIRQKTLKSYENLNIFKHANYSYK